jgi:hypothetical protein
MGAGLMTEEVDETGAVNVRIDIKRTRVEAKRQGAEDAKSERKRKSWLNNRKRICG